jgi:tRNA G46 methylase TrmB
LEICAGAGDWMIDRALVDKEADWYASEIRFDRVHEIWVRCLPVRQHALSLTSTTKMQRKKYMREADNVYIIAGDAVDAVKQIPEFARLLPVLLSCAYLTYTHSFVFAVFV